MPELKDMHIHRVSIVRRPANRRLFLLRKTEDDTDDEDELIEWDEEDHRAARRVEFLEKMQQRIDHARENLDRVGDPAYQVTKQELRQHSLVDVLAEYLQGHIEKDEAWKIGAGLYDLYRYLVSYGLTITVGQYETLQKDVTIADAIENLSKQGPVGREAALHLLRDSTIYDAYRRDIQNRIP